MENKNKQHKKYAGVIVQRDGVYYFRSNRGVIISVTQNDEIKKLCKDGSVVLFEELESSFGDFRHGQVVEVLGKSGDPIPEGRAIAKSYNLVRVPSKAVESQVKAIPQKVLPKQYENITDLRDVPFVTIDPDSAKDFDDAVYAHRNEDGTYTLKVAIANVASYISPDSPLFEYAMEAGNSSYLGETCYPMLPEELSNGICSLNEKEDRLVFCTTCTIKPNGQLVDYKIEPAVINSKHRLTYKQADALYFNNPIGTEEDFDKLIESTRDVYSSLEDLYETAHILYKARMKRGAFDIDSKQLCFKLDSTGTKVERYEKDHNEDFTAVIEETAILTNEIWGEVAQNFQIPFFYRNHKQIDFENLNDLRRKLEQFDIFLPKSVHSKDLQKIITLVKGKRIEEYVVSSILKAMESAYYDIDNIGHAGLAISANEFKSYQQLTKGNHNMDVEETINIARRNYFKETGRTNGLAVVGDITHSAYAQSTSPIRRGSDLVDQIQMLEFVNNGVRKFKTRDLLQYREGLNFCEMNSDRAEKEYNDMLSAKWASNNIGKIFTNCSVVNIGEDSAVVVSPDGYRMYLPYNFAGIKKKYLKIGKKIDKVAIDKVTFSPPRVTCTTNIVKTKDSESENEIV